MDTAPKSKTVCYAHLTGEIDYRNGTLTVTIEESGDAIVLKREWYPELQAIMAEVGHQAPDRPRR